MSGLIKNDKIFIAGHRGLVGNALVSSLLRQGYTNIVSASRVELDLRDAHAVKAFLKAHKPDVVVVAAAKVGGIHANNTYRADFIFDNLQIQNNLIWGSHENDVRSLCFLGSSCIYPRMAPQPMPEECLLTSPLEFTNRPYAVAKIAGLELVSSLRQQYSRNYFSVMPTNLYGPGDNFHPENSHVLPAFIQRFWQAKLEKQKSLKIWGTGKALREFMYVDDCADAIVHLLKTIKLDSFQALDIGKQGWSHINVGSGQEVSISQLAQAVAKAIGFEGPVEHDLTKPDGTPRKLLDISLLRQLGWAPRISLEEGLARTCAWYSDLIEKNPTALRR